MKNFRRPSSKERKIMDKFKKMRIKAILNDPDKNWIQKIIEVNRILNMDKIIKY